MPVEVVLPRVDMAMDVGAIHAWKVAPGDVVRAGDLLFEMTTDKATMEVEAPAAGIVGRLAVGEAIEVPVGTVVTRIYAPSENQADDDAPAPPAAVTPAPPAAVTVEVKSAAPAAEIALPAPPSGKRRATPLARRLARQNGQALDALVGSGPGGRIQSEDVLRATKPAQAPAERPQPGTAGLANRIAFREWRAGSARGTAFLLHGFGGNAQTWSVLAPLLAASGLDVIAPDLPAHGATTLGAGDIAEIAGPIGDFMAARAGGAAIELIGHSMGAAVAVRIATGGLVKLCRLTLLAPAGLGSEIDADFITGMADVRSGGGLAHLLRRVSQSGAIPSPELLDALAASLGKDGRLKALAAALVENGRQQIDIIGELGRITVPVRVVFGLADRIIPWTQVAALPARVAIHLLQRAGHMPQWDDPAALADLLH